MGILLMRRLFTILLVISLPVYAEDITLSWDNATEWTDRTPLVAGDLAETVIRYQFFPLGRDISTEPRTYIDIAQVSAGNTSYIHANVGDGIHCYTAKHIASNGIKSFKSNESCKTVSNQRPKRPRNLMAT